MNPAETMNLMREAAQHLNAGRFDAAVATCERVLAINPRDPNALHMMAQLAARAGRVDEALQLMSQAVAAAPNVAVLQHNYGMALLRAGQAERAVEALRRATQLQPDYAVAHYNLGMTLQKLRRTPEAVASLRVAVKLAPQQADTWNGLGCALGDIGELVESESSIRRALSLRPNDATILYNLGRVLGGLTKYDEAAEAYRSALRINPNHVTALLNLANILGEAGQIDETVALQRRTVELAPQDASLHSNLLLSLHYSPTFSPEQILQEHHKWAERHAPAERRKTGHANDRSPNRKLRIGYVSPDFCRHPVASFLESVLAGHDRSQFEVFGYSNAQYPDEMTTKLRGLLDGWRDISRTSDDDASKEVEDDRIDILIDLAGHTAHNRAPLMARGAAPVQVTYLGYPDTTGIPAVQFRLTDAYADPPGMTESHHTETLIRLSDCFLCYKPDDDVPDPGPPPSERNGFITFGSYNNFAKVTEPMMALWAQIMGRVPRSRLILKARALAGATAKQRVTDLFKRHSIEPERLTIVGWTEYAKRHQVIQDADVALDSFPYHGTTTTCEVLWAGVPWVTLAGRTHVSRVGVSILSNVGLEELIANGEAEYVEKAVALANDAARLTSLRRGLRDRLRVSPLLQRDTFARKLETAYREMWRRWCKA